MKSYDIVIVGAGPAGLTAALYSARNGLKVAVVSRDIGGTVNSILRIENWPGFSGSGPELIKMFYEQVKEYDIDFILEEVTLIDKNKKGKEFTIKTSKIQLKCKAVILATGTERKKLKIPGEEQFLGKGVSYCATCDSFFFKNKDVVVIGGSDCAAGSALVLADVAKKVYIVYRGEKLKCENVNEERLKQKKNVEVFYNSLPLEIIGKEKVQEIKIFSKGKKENLSVDGVFIEIGSAPLAEFTKNLGLKMDKENFIEVDEDMKTSVQGIYASGDVTHTKLKQVVVAASQGAIAAKSAYDFLNEK